MSDSDNKDPKLVALPGGGNPDAMRLLRENLESVIEYQEIKAQIQRAKYNALTEEGFTPDQAIELSKDVM